MRQTRVGLIIRRAEGAQMGVKYEEEIKRVVIAYNYLYRNWF
ncbi:hypothetical protein [Anaeromicropila populeti]|nr:hypothetical protein [Anaeromicropila populeti]